MTGQKKSMKFFLMISAILIDWCFVQLSSERFPLAVDGVDAETHSPTLIMLRFKLEVSIGSLPSEIGEPCGSRGKDGRSQRGCRTPGEHDPLSQPSRAHTGSQRMNQQARGIHGYTPGLLHEYMLWLLAWCSCESPHSGSECVFDSFASSWDFSFYLVVYLALI